MATIKEIAEKSGFSASTVSRLLNNDHTLSVTAETKKKIFDTAVELGYDRKNILPLIEKVALLYWITDREELEDVYFKQMRLELEKNARENNIELLLYKHDDGIKSIPNNISGFIAIGGFSTKEIQALNKKTNYGVFIDSNPAPDLFDAVLPDIARITKKAIDYFQKEGHKKIGFIGGTYHNPDTGQDDMDIREKTFRSYLQELNIFEEKYVFGEKHFSVQDGYSIAQKAINSLKEDLPTAFFIASDPIAVGSLQAFNEFNIAVPNRVSVISVNNISVTKYVSPPLSTFHIDIPELCKTAIKLLLEQIVENRKMQKTVLLNSELILRKSTK
ncbi:LacI family DNA-binding transcriptional regulator [Niallia nealsonii]|uniref:LacI family transcriptional regulator n=1 Tax=Niallia nealsonii TaxID=115979 RepID=A0A2N0Z2K2_9BACI|nr:LacI family DNA-binding transcriptional regulator [Niallia nealsonii]PKG23753.1 LacI family transcriptional regulator [Niallia nealsonii]